MSNLSFGVIHSASELSPEGSIPMVFLVPKGSGKHVVKPKALHSAAL
jgi:hypothetical protein